MCKLIARYLIDPFVIEIPHKSNKWITIANWLDPESAVTKTEKVVPFSNIGTRTMLYLVIGVLIALA